MNLGLSIHYPFHAYPDIPVEYFASLPSTVEDEATVHTLLNKKQFGIAAHDGAMKEIATSILTQMMTVKMGVKNSYSSQIPVDYGAYVILLIHYYHWPSSLTIIIDHHH